MEVRIDGFEDLLRRIVREEILAAQDGFLDVAGAAEYLSTTPKAIYRLVERQAIPHSRAGGRLVFDRRKLRAFAEGR